MSPKKAAASESPTRATPQHANPPYPPSVRKVLWVQRSNRTPALYWWSLPLALPDVAAIYRGPLENSRALVYPASALAACSVQLEAKLLSADVAAVSQVAALFTARAAGNVAPCQIAIVPPTRNDADLLRFAAKMRTHLEQIGFTIAIIPEGDGRTRNRCCFRVPGQVLAALEFLAHGRAFGGSAGQVELALLQGLSLKPKQRARLQLVIENDTAVLMGVEHGGCQRIRFLESGKGYTGSWLQLSLREAIRERLQESWRRVPVGVVLFAGLPFFIAAFWARNAFARTDARPRVERR